MGISKTFLFGIAGAALISVTALAHPHSKSEDNDKKEEKVKVYKFKDKDGEEKSTLKINDFEMDGFDLENFMAELEGLEGLEKLKSLESLKDLEGLGGLSALSRLSELSELSELAELGEFDVQTFDLDDGGKRIVIKRGKDGILGKHEFHWNDDKMHEKHAELMKKLHKEYGEHGEKSRHIIKRLMGDDHGDVTIWAESGKDGAHDIFKLENDTQIFIDDEGDVKVLNEDDDIAVNVEKEVTIKNGKRKTRIIIEMESDAE